MQNVPLIRLALSVVVAVSLLGAAPLQAQDAATATVTCKDGSSSKAGQGACGHHGGVNKDAAASAGTTGGTVAKAATAAAAPSAMRASAPAAATAGASTGSATAKCKDGTMSYSKTHSGSCSNHGGVAQFLDK